MKRIALALTLLTLSLAATAPALAAGSGVNYVRNHQTASGGIAETGGVPGVTLTEWSVMALRAAGGTPAALRRPGGKTPVSFLASGVRQWSGAYALERGILAVIALQHKPTTFGGRNLITALRSQVAPSTGRIGAYANSTYWGVMAFKAAGQPLPARSIAYIESHQQSNGGYSYLPQMPAGADSNDTAAAIMAMRSAGVPCSNTHIKRALGYLANVHIGGGGYPLLPGGAADSQSTSWAIQARLSCSLKNTAAQAWLAARHAADGSYFYAPGNHQTPVFVTAQVLPATNGRHYPIH
jgi:hypothetical protein